MTSVTVAPLTSREISTLIRLLGILQTHLESAIDSCLVPGETKVYDEADAPGVAVDRRDWKAAEQLVARLGELLAQRRTQDKARKEAIARALAVMRGAEARLRPTSAAPSGRSPLELDTTPAGDVKGLGNPKSRKEGAEK